MELIINLLDIIIKKNMANKLTERETIVIYMALLNALIDHIESDFRPSIFNQQALKSKSNGLLQDLLKLEERLYRGNPTGEVSDQYFQAGKLMVEFFRIGMAMELMDKTRAEGLNTQLVILMKNYGLNIDFN
jgi:hypothetical protein